MMLRSRRFQPRRGEIFVEKMRTNKRRRRDILNLLQKSVLRMLVDGGTGIPVCHGADILVCAAVFLQIV